MKLEQETFDESWLLVLEAKFLVCARDSNNLGSGLMNPIEIKDEKENEIFNLGESNFLIL